MGRVQSATLHILCNRERQIQTFVPQDYWSVYVDYLEGFRAYYRGNATAPTAESTQPDDATVQTESPAQESEQVLSQVDADRLVRQAQQSPHQVVAIEGKTTTRTPPPPFVTSTLQQAAGSRLRLSPETTMQVAQSLYEDGLITYMRTDSVALSPDFCAQARCWLAEHDPDNVPKKVAKHRSSKSAQEAHEAIRPTDLFVPSTQLRQKLSADAFSLYVLIWKRAVASQCQPARLQQTRILTQSGSIFWQAKGQTIVFAGYTKYWSNLAADLVLPTLQKGQPLALAKAAADQKQTQPPPRYSEPKLVQVMEQKGIGRPSTYAPTIQTLKQREYVELTKGVLYPTTLGLEVDLFLQDALPELLEAAFTAQMETELDAIAQGKQDWQRYLTTWNREYFAPALIKAQQVIPKYLTNNPAPRNTKPTDLSRTRCPQCKNYLAKIPSSKVKKKYFLKCVSGCENVVLFWSDRAKAWEVPHTKSVSGEKAPAASTILTEHSCPVCQMPLEEYPYEKDGQLKRLLRCSNPKARSDSKHKDVVYFSTANGWWSPKLGELPNRDMSKKQ